MLIEEIHQPQVIEIDGIARLRKYKATADFLDRAFNWYTDVETVYLVDGVKEPYTYERMKAMYRYLEENGELYIIEVLQDGEYIPVGDVTLMKDDMPIVIGDKSMRGKGLGRKVILALLERCRLLGFSDMRINEIYGFNVASRRCFESVGFNEYEKTEKGSRFIIKL